MDDDSGHADQLDPAIAVDTAGNAYAVWSDRRSGVADIYFAYRPAGGSWGANERLPECNSWDDDEFNPDIAADDTGRAYVVWDSEEPGIPEDRSCFSERSPAGVWAPPTPIGNRTYSNYPLQPSIAASPNGDLLLLYLETESVRRLYADSRPAGGTWTGPQELDHTDWRYRFAWDGAVDTAGNRYAVWAMSEYPYSDSQLLFAYQPMGGSWSTPEPVGEATSGHAGNVSIAVDGSGNSYASWTNVQNFATDVFFAYRPAGGPWGATVRINDDTNGAAQWASSIAADPTGNAYALWLDRRNPTSQVAFSYADHHDIVNSANPLAVSLYEAEEGARTGSMQLGADPGASTCQYVSDAVPFSGSAVTFAVTVPYPGDYYLWAWAKGTSWNNNSFFVWVDGSAPFHYEIGQFNNQWTWGWEPVYPEGQAVDPISLSSGSISWASAAVNRSHGWTRCSWSTGRTTSQRNSRPAAQLPRRRQPAHPPGLRPRRHAFTDANHHAYTYPSSRHPPIFPPQRQPRNPGLISTPPTKPPGRPSLPMDRRSCTASGSLTTLAVRVRSLWSTCRPCLTLLAPCGVGYRGMPAPNPSDGKEPWQQARFVSSDIASPPPRSAYHRGRSIPTRSPSTTATILPSCAVSRSSSRLAQCPRRRVLPGYANAHGNRHRDTIASRSRYLPLILQQ